MAKGLSSTLLIGGSLSSLSEIRIGVSRTVSRYS